MTVHSFRRVLRVKRHIHAIPWNPDGRALVLPVPVPLLGVTYFAILEVAFFLISRLPIVGGLSHLPFKVWWVIPFWWAYLAITSSFDGRTPHDWTRSWVLYQLRPKRTRAGLPVRAGVTERLRGRVRWFADEHYPRLTRSRVNGPAVAHFRVPVRYGYDVALSTKAEVARSDERAESETFRQVGHRLEVKP